MNKRKKKHKIRYFRIGMALILLVLIIIGIVFIAIRIPGKGKVSVPAGNTPVTADPAEQTSAGSSQEPTTEALPIIFYPELTAYENLLLVAKLKKCKSLICRDTSDSDTSDSASTVSPEAAAEQAARLAGFEKILRGGSLFCVRTGKWAAVCAGQCGARSDASARGVGAIGGALFCGGAPGEREWHGGWGKVGHLGFVGKGFGG